MKDSVLIVSGGMDSITMLYEYKDRIAIGLSFDYGSNHNAREIPFARMHCERLGIRHIVINLDFMHRYFKECIVSLPKAAAHIFMHYLFQLNMVITSIMILCVIAMALYQMIQALEHYYQKKL